MAKKKKKRRKKPPIKKWMRKADKALSEYIRALFGKESPLCPLCKEKPLACAFHIVRRERKIIRWTHRNVISTCHGCNLRENFHPDYSRAYFIRRYGVDLYLRLVDAAEKDFEPSIEYLMVQTEKYQKLYKNLMGDKKDGN